MQGHVDSLNVSVAAGVVLFEAVGSEAGRVKAPDTEVRASNVNALA